MTAPEAKAITVKALERISGEFAKENGLDETVLTSWFKSIEDAAKRGIRHLEILRPVKPNVVKEYFILNGYKVVYTDNKLLIDW